MAFAVDGSGCGAPPWPTSMRTAAKATRAEVIRNPARRRNLDMLVPPAAPRRAANSGQVEVLVSHAGSAGGSTVSGAPPVVGGPRVLSAPAVGAAARTMSLARGGSLLAHGGFPCGPGG